MGQRNFTDDPRRVMVAARDRCRTYSSGPVRAAQLALLNEGIAGMERQSFEYSALHQTYRMALVILGKER